MNKKLQVFVSSTYTDLKEERQAAVEAILGAGHIPAGMELFKAGNESQLQTIYKWIDESDVFMLILGGRYGSIEPKSNKSYTQLEYEYAISKNIPIFAVVLSESFLTTKINLLGLSNIMEQDAPNKYRKFKNIVMSKIIRIVNDCKDIQIVIHSSLNEFLKTYPLIGWSRNVTETDISILQQKNKKLSIDNNSLKKVIIKLKKQLLAISKDDNVKNDISSVKEESNYTNTIELNLMDYDEFSNIKYKLQSSCLRISSNNNSNDTVIRNCFLIFLDNYALLQKGVLSPIFNKATRLLYNKICPVFEHHNLVIKEYNAQYGFIYKITETGTAFYNTANMIA